MSNTILKEKQAEFIHSKLEDFLTIRKALNIMREKFLRKFDKSKIKQLKIDNYVIGKGETFCKIIENDLDRLGSMKGSPASKFGVYFGTEKPETFKTYRFKPKWGTNYQEAYQKVIDAIDKLLDDGYSENIDAIVMNPISSMFKGKILSIYYPDRFLSIFSNDHLDHFLRVFNLDTSQNVKSDPVLKREILLKFKESDSIFKNWEIDMFTYFLYNIYPLKPVKVVESPFRDSVNEFLPIKFEIAPVAKNIHMEIKPQKEKPKHNNERINLNNAIDYIEKNKRNSEVGSRGEKVVMEYEISKLQNIGKVELVQSIKQVSIESDDYGYDILSFNMDDSKERFIEVKTTVGKPGETIFYISENELKKAKSLENY